MNRNHFRSQLGRNGKRKRAFSLVEVTLALGLVAYSLVALLGLFAVGLSSSRSSSVETALSQIVMHISSTYDGSLAPRNAEYTYDGVPCTGSNGQKFFDVTVLAKACDSSTIANTSTNLHLLTLSISSPENPGMTNVVQTSAFVP